MRFQHQHKSPSDRRKWCTRLKPCLTCLLPAFSTPITAATSCKHLPPQLCNSFSCPQMPCPCLWTCLWPSSQALCSMNQVRWVKAIDTVTNDPLSHPPQRPAPGTSTQGPLRPLPTVLTSSMTFPWTGFPTFSVSLLWVPRSCSLESPAKISYLQTLPCFLRLSVQANRGCGTHTSSLRCSTPILIWTSLGHVCTCTLHTLLDPSGIFICIEELNCSQEKWSICLSQPHQGLILNAIISYATVDYITKNPSPLQCQQSPCNVHLRTTLFSFSICACGREETKSQRTVLGLVIDKVGKGIWSYLTLQILLSLDW